jgi:hypothetical protein
MTPEIEIELQKCKLAFETNPSDYAWCCHHEVLVEKLTEPYINRIEYILSDKLENEQVIRFRNFRPVVNGLEVVKEYTEKRDILYKDYNEKWDILYKDYKEKYSILYKDYIEKRDILYKYYEPKLLAAYKLDVLEGTWKSKSIFDN